MVDIKKAEGVVQACDELIEEVNMPILLEDTEIIDAVLSASGSGGDNLPASNQDKAVCRAQLKRVAEWGDEMCHDHILTVAGITAKPFIRRFCEPCWQALLKEAGL